MNKQQIQAHSDTLTGILNQAVSDRQYLEFLERVVRQAILTHGGEIKVDPALAEQAKAETRLIDISDGGIRLVERPDPNALSAPQSRLP